MTEVETLLVTGASGFLGSRIVELAREEGWRVRAVDRRPIAHPSAVDVRVGDIFQEAFLESACEGVTCVIHAAGLAHLFGNAASSAELFTRVNEIGTDTVARSVAKSGVRHLVLVSSVSVYGEQTDGNCNESHPCHPSEPYASSKYRAELRAIGRLQNHPTALTILRFATIYGEGDRGNVARLIHALESRRFMWLGPGQNRKSLIHRDDAARACLLAAGSCPAHLATFNVSGSPATMREIVVEICEALGRPIPRIAIPLSLVCGASSLIKTVGNIADLSGRLAKFVSDSTFDPTKFNETFAFTTTVSLCEGIRREVRAIKSRARE